MAAQGRRLVGAEGGDQRNQLAHRRQADEDVEPASASTSIAVLPFDNLGGDERTGRLADGITEDIITDLSRFRAIEVIARNSVMVYKGKHTDVRQIGKDLNVRFVLEGSIQRESDQVRITAQLIEAPTGTHIWSNRWDRPIANVFTVQSELAEQVAAKLAGEKGIVLSADRAASKRKRPSDLTAYDLFLLGSAAIYRETPEDNKQAIALLMRSVEIDPDFARAWKALSLAHFQSVWWGNDSPEVRQLSLEAAERAVQLDPLDADAHSQLANQLGQVGDLVQSEIEYKRALELNPNSADISLATSLGGRCRSATDSSTSRPQSHALPRSNGAAEREPWSCLLISVE